MDLAPKSLSPSKLVWLAGTFIALPFWENTVFAVFAQQTQSTTAMSLKNITDANGIQLALVGMLIVFSVLVIIASFIAALPHIMRRLETILPESDHHHHAPAAPALVQDDSATDEEVVAAIGFTLHSRR